VTKTPTRAAWAIATIGLLPLLVSCANDESTPVPSPDDPPSANVTTTATVTATPTPLTADEEADARFWHAMEQAGEDVFEADREGVAENARLVCTAFDAGKGVYRIGVGLNKLGLTIDQAGHLMGAAVQAYCPEHFERFTG
jgi:hypothetical protein